MDVPALAALVRDVPDFPEPGILFKDITPVLAKAEAFALVVDELCARIEPSGASVVAGIEARGFVFAAPVAAELGLGFVPVRKRGKLPWRTVAEEYALEYGSATVEIHEDAIDVGAKVAIVDDVLATGGTAAATCALVERLGGEVAAVTVLIELLALGGRARLAGRTVDAILTY